MREKYVLYFALGVVGLASVIALTNRVASAAPTVNLSLDSDGITFPDETVQTTAARRDPRLAFYLTATEYTGDQASGSDGLGADVCADGFHFASGFEILDVSNLRYATDTEADFDALRAPDSGYSAPADQVGWMRSGGEPLALLAAAWPNCDLWATQVGFGAAGFLDQDGWDRNRWQCDSMLGVWCVETSQVYLDEPSLPM